MNDTNSLALGGSSAAGSAASRWAPLKPTQALLQGFDFGPAATDARPEAEARPTQPPLQPSQLLPARPLAGEQQRQGFRIGPIGLMAGYAQGSELSELPRVHRLPHAPAWFAGICNLHGALVPVFDLACRLAVERNPQARPMLLVLGHGANAAGLVIDGIPIRLRFDAAALADTTTVPDALAGLVSHAAVVGDALWFDLDVPALLESLAQAH